jgi:uncharacterized protein YggE
MASRGFSFLIFAGALFLLSLFVTEVKSLQFVGRNIPGELSTISVSGEGEKFATPNIATVSFVVTESAPTASGARKVVDEKMTKIHDLLLKSGVKEVDIKGNYNLNPKFEWRETRIECIAYPCVQPPGKQILIGYEVSESVAVTIRNIDTNPDTAGLIVGGLADTGATNVSGPDFTLENTDAVQAEARAMAIAKAKAKAEKLASDLGVSLVRITSFNEGGGVPYTYASGLMMNKSAFADSASVAPAYIPSGQDKYTSNVTITYEVR